MNPFEHRQDDETNGQTTGTFDNPVLPSIEGTQAALAEVYNMFFMDSAANAGEPGQSQYFIAISASLNLAQSNLLIAQQLRTLNGMLRSTLK